MNDNDYAGLETSNEIIAAIEYLGKGRACDSNSESYRIWSNPTMSELVFIKNRVTQNGLIASTDFVWGAAENNWATPDIVYRDIEAEMGNSR